MDSLKLDRFRKLLNRQNTSLSIGGSGSGTSAAEHTGQQQRSASPLGGSQSRATSSVTTTSGNIKSSNHSTKTTNNLNNNNNQPIGGYSATIKSNAISKATQTSILAITASIPDHLTKDNPKPAHFIARKLFNDFTELANRKIVDILVQRHEQQQQPQQQQQLTNKSDRSLFKSLQCGEDLIYDQILRALGASSEYCLPSLLKLLLSWYDFQMGAYDEAPGTQQLTNVEEADETSNQVEATSFSLDLTEQQREVGDKQPAECGCLSPCINESHSLNNSTSLSNNSAVRSPTPSSPDLAGSANTAATAAAAAAAASGSTQVHSITSSLPLDYQSPASIVTRDKDEAPNQHQSAANTSNSTATNTSLNSTSIEDATNLTKRLELTKTRALLIEYAFCQALIEIFSKLYLHPGYADLTERVEEIAFSHFTGAADGGELLVDSHDIKRLADKYAEVLGVLARTRFKSVRRRFMSELVRYQEAEPTPANIQALCTLLTSMKYFRAKMAPIEEFEASFAFLQELADYFVIVRHKSIKHALAELFVEIMLPVASMVKNEVKIPCLKNFVESLWTPTLDMCSRKKHSSTLFPLVTCLLCVSQRAVFLQNWSTFLNMCLSNLKNRDQKMCRIALESLYRLIWIYMIRIKGESNNITQTRLNSIVDALFPRGSRQIVPRDTPLVIFVDIIQFIAQERLDFALRHIIFELLSVDRSIKMIMAPERMNIGLQAFLVIADNLQQKESEPTMPLTIGSASAQQLAQIMQSAGTSSAAAATSNQQLNSFQQQQQHAGSNNSGQYEFGAQRRSHAHKMLTDEIARSIGLHPYHNHIQKSFNEILKTLDVQFGRPLMLTSSQLINKELDDMITAEKKAKVDLFKTCVAAIPRLMPDGMSKADLIDLLARMTIHIDEEMRRYAFESLRTLVTEFQEWRLDAIEGFTLFLANQIDESLRNLVDNALKMLLQLLISWHGVITSSSSSSSSEASSSSCTRSFVTIQTGYETISSRNSGAGGQIAARKNRALAEMRLIQSELANTRFDRLVNVIQKVEGASLVMLCSCHGTTRKLASLLLRECRAILRCYSSWTCMEQFGFRSPVGEGENGAGEEEELSVSLKGSLSADNLSRITTTSVNGLFASSMTSMNTQALLSTSVSKMCISGGGGGGGGNAAFHHGLMSSGSNNNQQQQQPQQQQRHDLYDEDIENNLTDFYSQDDNSTLILWIALMMLDSDRETEYTFALRLLRTILPKLPFERQEFLDELERNLKQMEWDNFPGVHALVLKGCASPTTYDLCVSLLDHMTPIIRHHICTAANKPEDCLPFHVLVLSTQLLATYEDPPPFSLNIARRLSLCCEENSSKLENLSAVMTLYSRRSFSKDSFQWIKCVAKYLNDACPHVLPEAITFLIDLLENGPAHVQRQIVPMLYCILTYVDINQQHAREQQSATAADEEEEEAEEELHSVPTGALGFNSDLVRLYNKCLGCEPLWRDATQLFKLIIAKSSALTDGTLAHGHELPGRTMDFVLDVESGPLIAKAHLAELGVLPAIKQQQQATAAPAPQSLAQPQAQPQPQSLTIVEHVQS